MPIPPSYQCVIYWNLCDGRVDTRDGSDEVLENCKSLCHSDRLQEYKQQLFNLVPTGRCMVKWFLCDGIQDSAEDTTEDPEVCDRNCIGEGFITTADRSVTIN